MLTVSLRKKEDFFRLKKSTNKFFTKCAVIVIAKTPHADDESQLSIVRVGFIVTKKVGIAVQRNKARRRLKAAFRKISGSCKVAGLDIIFIARKNALSIKFADIVSELMQIFQKLKLNNENI